MNYGILLAGGTGARTGLDRPKQFETAGGFYMLTYSVKPLLTYGGIDAVCVVAEEDWRDRILKDIQNADLPTEKIHCFALPGENRQLSILNGMEAILRDMEADPTDEDTILIHDAARPFLTEELLSACYDALPDYDGVMPVLPMKDTVYLSETGKSITRLLEREKIYAGQAPELFRLRSYYHANKTLMPNRIRSINGAAEPAVMFGMEIGMIPGDEKNFKVTTPSDMETYRALMER